MKWIGQQAIAYINPRHVSAISWREQINLQCDELNENER